MIQQALVLILMMVAIAACSSATAEAPNPQPIAPVETPTATTPESEPESDPAAPNQPRQLKLKFEVEKPEDLQVAEGDRLQAGQVVALRPGRATLQTRLAQLQFELSQPPLLPSSSPQAAAAARDQAKIVLLQAQSRLSVAQAEAEQAQALLNRWQIKGLPPHGKAALTMATRDQLVLEVQAMQQQLKTAEQQLQQAIAQAKQQAKQTQWQAQQRQMELNSVQAQLDALVVKAPYSGRVRRIRWLEQVGGQVKVEIALQVSSSP
ncbi:hypothetical protein [Synechococcus elongatus]|uniref:hypothetical protein n=1 Tax=Synechococcus elongatus TaxID=32046 RepID=UPI0030D29682